MHSLFRAPAEAAVQMKTWHTLRIQQQSLGDQPLSQEVVSSPGAVVDELSQNFILQQAAYMEDLRTAQQGFPRRLSMPSADWRVWNSPAQPSP